MSKNPHDYSNFERALQVVTEHQGKIGRPNISKAARVNLYTAKKAQEAYQKGARSTVPVENLSLVEELELDLAFQDMPDGIDTELKNIEIVGKRVLILSDIHFPYHDKKAILEALRDGLHRNVDAVYINGDTVDTHRLSVKYTPQAGSPSYKEELDITRSFLQQLRSTFPKAELYFKMGNHEDRLENYLMSKAPELANMQELTLENLLELQRLGIRYVHSKQLANAGKLYVAHGHEYRTFFGGGVHHARNTRLKAGDNIVFGHFHRTQNDFAQSVGGSIKAAWATGCLCKLNPAYIGKSQWNHGYAIVDVHSHDRFSVENKIILP